MKRSDESEKQHEMADQQMPSFSQSYHSESFLKKVQRRNEKFSTFVNKVLNRNAQVSDSESPAGSSAETIINKYHVEPGIIYDDDDLQKYASDSDDGDDEIVHQESTIEFENFSRRIEMNEMERIMIILLHQARFNTTNKEIEIFSKSLNNMAYRHCCTTGGEPIVSCSDWDTIITKVPNSFTPTIYKYFYSQCGDIIGPVNELNIPTTCCYSHESCRIIPSQKMKSDSSSFFCYIPLSKWLHHQIPLYYSKLRITRPKESKFFHDLSNSERYRQLVTSSSSCSIPTLTLTLTWDGVAYTNDGSQSMWPLCAYLNELPFQERINNPMLIALHSGSCKPSSDIVIKPLVDELVSLSTDPIIIDVDGNEKKFFVKLLLAIADAPARAVLLNSTQFNGYYGCQCCEIKGTYDNDFKSMLYIPNRKYDNSLSFDFKLRTNISWRSIASNNRGKSTMGIKGNCQLMKLSYVDMSIICPPEAMHSQYLGTVKSIINRWLDDDLATKRWYQVLPNEKKNELKTTKLNKTQLSIVDERLSSIKFPEGVLKAMPQLSQKRNLKSMDYELLLFYGFICFEGIVERGRCENFKQLAFILSKLSSRMISKMTDLRHVDSEIAKFFTSFDQVYSSKERFMWKINVHFLAHFLDMVKNYGPLPVQTAYFTENTMGLIAKRVKTGTNVTQQVMKKFLTYQSIISSCRNNTSHMSEMFLKSLYNYMPKLCPNNTPIKVFQEVYKPIGAENKLLGQGTFQSQKRIRIKEKIVCTRNYNQTAAKSTNNHCIKTEIGKYYIVEKIIKNDRNETYLICNEFLNCQKLLLRTTERKLENLHFSYIKTFSKISTMTVKLKCSDFSELATYANVNGVNYLFDIFNKHL